MIPREDPYGWGVFSIPMSRELRAGGPSPLPPGNPAADLARMLAHDTPWRAVIISVLMTCLAFSCLLLLGRSRPVPLLRPKPAPVEVTVLLREEVRELPRPAVVKAPVPVPVRKKAPPPLQAPQRIVRQAPVPPPEPPPVRQVPPAEAPLPRPSQMTPPLPERLAEARSPLPSRKAEMAVQPEASLPVAPSLASYDQTPRPAAAAVLPKQTSSFDSAAPTAGLVAQPAPGRVADRAPARESLPSAATAALGSPAGAELSAVDTGLSSVRYETPSAAPALPSPVRRETVATGRGGEAEIGSPQGTGVRTDIGERASDAQQPASGRTQVAFAGAGPEETLRGPAATVRNNGSPAATALPAGGGSFDFLDFVAPADLDRSVMVSLNRLRTCLDPEAEMKLKTRLAALLGRPALCRSGGVIFDIRNPESAYSIHIDLYNYERREFQDRCDALRLAVQSCEARR